MRKVVANTTPLIALADIGKLDLLHQIYNEILIPQAVLDEVISEPAKTLVKSAEWIKVFDISNPDQKSSFSTRLHSGEIEVILLAQEKDADLLIMDDNAAKKTAKYLGLNVTGTLGVVIKAKQEGLIDSVKEVIDQLILDGLFIDERLIHRVLESAGEI